MNIRSEETEFGTLIFASREGEKSEHFIQFSLQTSYCALCTNIRKKQIVQLNNLSICIHCLIDLTNYVVSTEEKELLDGRYADIMKENRDLKEKTFIWKQVFKGFNELVKRIEI